MRKGQVSLWIITGIIILILVIIGVVLVITTKRAEIVPELDILPIRAYVEGCVDDAALTGIFTIGKQGGYIFPKGDYVFVEFDFVSVGFNIDENVLVSEKEMEQELANYIKIVLPDCVGKVRQRFVDYGFEFGDVDVDVDITDADVHVDVLYQVSVRKGNAAAKIERFVNVYDIRLGHARNIADKIIDSIKADPDWIDVTTLGEYDMKVNLVPQDLATIIYVLSEPSRYGDTFVFAFGARYKINHDPVLELPDTLELKRGERFVYQVVATDDDGDRLTFSDDDGMFDITDDGLIDFVPYFEGRYDVKITVVDEHRGYDEKEVRFVIT
ncbi:hypothetical protein DRJ17_03785 [Candidatus Woesearchaeota archaeon]|nr:MAG: hypothetical protein DRJ17_03785 [Candidatus Woesearchaeota archaeon]